MAELLESHRVGKILRLTIQNPPANLLSVEVMRQLQEQLEEASSDESTRLIVIAAAGKLFSAGHDLKEMTAHRLDPDRGRGYFEQVFALCSRLMQSISGSLKPVIAEVDGVATAAGCQLIASCDLAYASDRSKFGVNGIDVGLFCSTPAVALTRTVSRKRAMEMLLTGEMIDAATACEWGLVNRVVPSEALTDTVMEYANLIAAKSPTAVELGKRALSQQAGLDLAKAYERTSVIMVENMLADDAAEGIGAFLEKRKPKWRNETTTS